MGKKYPMQQWARDDLNPDAVLLQSAILTKDVPRGRMFRHTYIIANPNYKPGDVLTLRIFNARRPRDRAVEQWSLLEAGDPISSNFIAWWDAPANTNKEHIGAIHQ